MNYEKKILVAYVNDGQSGGVDKYIMNYYETLKESVHFDFLTNKKDNEFEVRLKRNGSKLIEVKNLKHPFLQVKQIAAILKEGKYDAFYLNTSTALSYIAMKAAYLCNTPLRICHSHSSGIDSSSVINRFIINRLHKLCKKKMVRYANRYLACSTAAAEWMYTEKVISQKKYELVNNAFSVEEYTFSQEKRNEMRNQLSIDNKKVIGFVGSLCYQKNIPFVLEIFSQIKKIESESILLMIGDGPLMEYACQRARDLNIDESTLFLGKRKDVKNLLQAMDVLLAPSAFEGLSFVSLEAQAAGLKCFLSKSITNESEITPNCNFLDLSLPAEDWAKAIISNINYVRTDTYKFFEEKGYVLSKTKEKYLNLLNMGDKNGYNI